MTYSPPPQGGYQPPGQYGPPPGQYGPPPGQYGPPPGQYGPPRRGFDPTGVNPLDWAIMGTAVLALIFSFFTFYTAKLTVRVAQYGVAGSKSVHASAWHGFFGWFAVVLAVVAALLVVLAVLAPRPQSPFRLISLAASCLALVSVVIAAFVTPTTSSESDVRRQVGDQIGLKIDVSVDYGRGVGFWLVLVSIALAAALGVVRYLQPGRTRADAPPGYSYGAPQGYQQWSGYQQSQTPGGYPPPPPGP